LTFQGTANAIGGSGQIASIQWDFNYNGVTFNPDAGANGSLTPARTFSTPGTYLVALQVTDVCGNSSMDVTAVTVKPADALLVRAGSDRSVTPGTAVTFSGFSSYPGGAVTSSG